jgi:hypothetical protein
MKVTLLGLPHSAQYCRRYRNRLYPKSIGSVLLYFYVMAEAGWISGCVSE